jgi:tetratricopeptide (TPR) repeat protein
MDCRRDLAAAIAWYQAHPETPPAGFKTVAAMKSRLDSSLIDMRAVAVVESPQHRQENAALQLDTGDVGGEAGWDSFARGLAAASAGDTTTANTDLAELNTVRQKISGTPEDQNTSAYLEIIDKLLAGVIAEGNGQSDAGLAEAIEAARNYDALPFDFGPPVPVKPPHELAGEMLLALHRPKEALAEFDSSLRSAPRRSLSLLGRARALAMLNDSAGAIAAYRALLAIWRQADDDTAGLLEAKAALRSDAADKAAGSN